MKEFHTVFRGGRVYLKLGKPSSKAAQLNHQVKPTLQKYTYDAATIHLGINDIVHCKNEEELKELPKKKNENSAYMPRIQYWKNIYFIHSNLY